MNGIKTELVIYKKDLDEALKHFDQIWDNHPDLKELYNEYDMKETKIISNMMRDSIKVMIKHISSQAQIAKIAQGKYCPECGGYL